MLFPIVTILGYLTFAITVMVTIARIFAKAEDREQY
jgi:hypothetical protein